MSIGALRLSFPANNQGVTGTDGINYTVDLMPEGRAPVAHLGFCPNPPPKGVEARNVSLFSSFQQEVLDGRNIPVGNYETLVVTPDATPPAGQSADWALISPVGDGALQTAGMSPDGLILGALCNAEDAVCNVWAISPELGIRVSLTEVAHDGAVAAGDTLPDDLITHATAMFDAVLALR